MKPRAMAIAAILNKTYPNPRPFLNFKTPFQLLVATILSAQCTDARVNIVTKELFEAASTPKELLALGKKRLIAIIRPTGFYNAKAKHLLESARILVQEFAGSVPQSLEKLMLLPGVGRKTASVVLAQAFHIPTFPVDRHVHRVALRLGLSKSKDPEKTDLDLRRQFKKEIWIPLHIQMISHGRTLCKPKPLCPQCPLVSLCPFGKKWIKRFFL